MKVSVAQSCQTLCNPIDCSLPGSSVHGIPQARILEWVAIPFSWGFSQPRDQTWVSCIAGRFFKCLSHREATIYDIMNNKKKRIQTVENWTNDSVIKFWNATWYHFHTQYTQYIFVHLKLQGTLMLRKWFICAWSSNLNFSDHGNIISLPSLSFKGETCFIVSWN